MNSSKKNWYQCMLDLIEKVERRTMGTDEYLEAERLWANAKEKLLMLIPEDKRLQEKIILNQMEEAEMHMYTIMLEAVVCAVEFKDFDLDI
mgnify:CR=1 FL=1